MTSLTTGEDGSLTISTDANTDRVLKTDVLGRVRTPRERREVILSEFSRSGLSAAQFARLAGINYSTFAQWVQLHRRAAGPLRRRATRGRSAVRLVEAVVGPRSAKSSGPGLVLQLPGGARLELSHPAQVPLAVTLLQQLAAPC